MHPRKSISNPFGKAIVEPKPPDPYMLNADSGMLVMESSKASSMDPMEGEFTIVQETPPP